MQEKKIGIYKITSPSGRVYIGQSIDIEARIKNHSKWMYSTCKGKLQNSFKKYGFEKHTFKIVRICPVSRLNKWERYYQDLYDVLGVQGLNQVLVESNSSSGSLSQETKDKMVIAHSSRVLRKLDKPDEYFIRTKKALKLVELINGENSRNKVVLNRQLKEEIKIQKALFLSRQKKIREKAKEKRVERVKSAKSRIQERERHRL